MPNIPANRPYGSPYARAYGATERPGTSQSLENLRAAFSPPGTRVKKAKSGVMVPCFDEAGNLVGVVDQSDLKPLGSGPTPKTPAPAAPAPAAPAQDPVDAAVAKSLRGRDARRTKVAKSLGITPPPVRIASPGGRRGR